MFGCASSVQVSKQDKLLISLMLAVTERRGEHPAKTIILYNIYSYVHAYMYPVLSCVMIRLYVDRYDSCIEMYIFQRHALASSKSILILVNLIPS